MSKRQAVRFVVDRSAEGKPGAYVCLINVHATVEADRSPELRAAVDHAFLAVPDGMPLVWLLRRRGHASAEKITGIEYIPSVAATGLARGTRHFFYGGAPGVALEAGRRLCELIPGVKVVGALSPPFADIDKWPIGELKAALRRTKPHILWVGLGAPKQELWMAKMSGALDVPVMLGVGAGIDYLAGAKLAAPPFLRHIGLEWLFRLAIEPRRLWRRYLLGNSAFIYLLGRSVLRRQLERIGSGRNSPGRGR